jgi:hypothetical protein
MTLPGTFSTRNRFSGAPKQITIWEDAPESLRVVVLETARALKWGPSAQRDVVCRVLRIRPDQGNWSEYPNIWAEVQWLVYGCEWFKVYDIIEALHAGMEEHDRLGGGNASSQLAQELNSYFVDEGIGWQLVSGLIVSSGRGQRPQSHFGPNSKNLSRPSAATARRSTRTDMGVCLK